MGFVANRLEENWSKVGASVLKEWPLLTETDLELVDGRFDLLVTLIRSRYGGRVEIVQEAAIRDVLNRLLKQLEA